MARPHLQTLFLYLLACEQYYLYQYYTSITPFKRAPVNWKCLYRGAWMAQSSENSPPTFVTQNNAICGLTQNNAICGLTQNNAICGLNCWFSAFIRCTLVYWYDHISFASGFYNEMLLLYSIPYIHRKPSLLCK